LVIVRQLEAVCGVNDIEAVMKVGWLPLPFGSQP